MRQLLAILALCGCCLVLPVSATVWNVKTNCGATGNGSTNDTAAVNTCIGDLTSGDTLYFPSGTYLVSHLTTISALSNIVVYGDSQALSIIKGSASGVIWQIGAATLSTGTASVPSGNVLLASTSDLSSSFTVGSTFASTLSPGNLIYLWQGGADGNCSPSNTAQCDSGGQATAVGCEVDGCRSEVAKVASVSGTTVTVIRPLNNPYNPSVNLAGVAKINGVLAGINIHDLTFDGASTANVGLYLVGTDGLLVNNLTAKNTIGAGFSCGASGQTVCGWQPTISNITETATGSNGGFPSPGGSAFVVALTGYPTVSNVTLSSLNTNAFGVQLGMSGGAVMNNISVDKTGGTAGRGIKQSAGAHTVWNNVTVTNAPAGYECADVTYYSHHVTYIGGIFSGCNTIGIDGFGNFNDFLTLINVTMTVGANGSLVNFVPGASGLGRRDINTTVSGGTFSGTSGFEEIQAFGNNAYIHGATIGAGTNGINISSVATTGNCINNNTFVAGLGYAYAGSGSTGKANGNVFNGNSVTGAFVTGACATTFLPLSLGFGSQVVGSSSAAQAITLTNSTASSVTISEVTATGDYSQTNNCGTLASNASCSINVTFTPSATGTRSGYLLAYPTTTGGTATIPLSGNGSTSSCSMPNPCAYNGTDVVSWSTAPNLGNAINNGLTVFDTSFLGSGCAGGVCHNFDGSAFTNSSLLSPITRLTDSKSVPGVTNGTFVAGQGGSGVIVATNTNTSLVGFSGNGPEYVCLFNTATGHCSGIGTGIAIPTSFNNAGGGSANVGENFGSIFFSLTDPTVLYAFGNNTDVTLPTTVTPYSINTTTGKYTVGFPTKNASIVDFKYGLPLGAANAPNWQASHAYHYGDYVTHQLTSAEMARGTGIRAASTAYALGDIVTQNGTAGTCMYKVTVAGTSSSGAAPAFLASGCKLDTLSDGATLKWHGTASTAQFTYQNTGANGVLSNASVFQWIHSPVTLSTNTCSMPLNSAVLTCTNAPFTASMVGQTISVTGAGASGGVLYATILTFTSSTVVSLAFPATTAATTTSASLTGHPDLLSQVIDANGIVWTNVGTNYIPTLGSQAWAAAAGVSRDSSYPGTSYSGKYGMALSTNSYGDNYPNGGYSKYNSDQDTGIWALEYDAVTNIYHLLNTGTGIWTDWSCSGGTGYSCTGGTRTPSVIGTMTNIVNPAGVTPVTGITTQACPYYIHNEKMSKNGNHEVLTTHVVYPACNPLQNFEVWQPLTSVFPFDALNSLQITFFGLNHWDIGTDKIMAFSPGGWGSGSFLSIYDASKASTQANFSTFLKPNVNLSPPPYPEGCHTVSGTNPDCTLGNVLDSHLSVSGDHGNDLYPACGTTYNYKTLGPAINAWQNKETCYPVTPSFNSVQANSVNPVWQFSNDFNTHTSTTFSTQFSVSEYSQDAQWLFWSSDWNCGNGSTTGVAPSVWASGTHIGFLAVPAVPASPSSLCGLPWAAANTYVVGNLINPIEGTSGSGQVDDVFQAIYVNGKSGPQSSLSGFQPKCGTVSCFTATTAPTVSAAGSTLCDNQNYNGTTQLNTLNPALPYSTSCPNGNVWQDLGPQTGRGDVFAAKLTPTGGAPNLAATPVCSPGTGTYTTTQSVTCTDASVGAIMCFSTNGSTPATNGSTGCASGTLYSTAISVASSETLRVIAGGTGYLDSSIASYIYTINPVAATPVCSPVGGTYTSTQTVSCTDSSVGSIMCFTTNGSTPATNGTTGCTAGSVYFGSITVAISETLKVVAGGSGFTDGSVASYAYVINFPTAATPTFSPVAGTYNPTQSVTISTTSPGAILCWNTTGSPATNGITGCTTGTLYSGPVSVGVSETLYAVAGGSGYVDSSVGSAAYVIKLPAATPVCTPGTGSYTAAQSVTCTDSSSGAIMCYTTSGTTPATNGTSGCTAGTLYSGAIAISGSSTLKVIGGGTAYIDGPVGSFVYTINFPTIAATPSCSPVGGTYTSTQSVTCTDSSSGAVMCYTVNGSTPATNGSTGCTTGILYSGAISVASTETLKIIAGGTSYVDSSIATYAYTINPVAATPSCSPVAGTYASPQSATCTDASSGSIMCYTTNGGTPATNGTSGCTAGTLYSGAISVAISETLKVIGGGTGYTDGSVASYAYVITVPTAAATPSCSPVGATYTVSQSVSCTDASAGAVMCYTTNGTTPSTNGVSGCTTGTLYSTAISISTTQTLKVIAGGTSYLDSLVATNAYVISPIAATPVCSPIAGSYASAQSVTCTDASSGAVMCFTTNGATPATNSVSGCTTGTVYSGVIAVASSQTIKIIAGGTGYTDGTVASYTYVINGQPVAPVTSLFARVVKWKGGIQLTWIKPVPQPDVSVNSYSVWRGSNPLLPNPSKIATVIPTSYFDKHCRGVCCYEVRANDTVGTVPTAVVSGPSNIACVSN